MTIRPHPRPSMLSGRTWSCRLGRHHFQRVRHVFLDLIPADGEFHSLDDYAVDYGSFCRRCGVAQ